jgi:hypothetical protein
MEKSVPVEVTDENSNCSSKEPFRNVREEFPPLRDLEGQVRAAKVMMSMSYSERHHGAQNTYNDSGNLP